MRATSILAAGLVAALARAHFVLNYPASLGFDDDNEPNGPCGGEDIVFASNDTSVEVGGFSVALLTTHPAASFLYRATLSKQAPFNWTNLVPVVSEKGVGNFCLPQLNAPSSFAGQQGLIQVVVDGPDGILYQCAAVNFVTGNGATPPSQCTNATGVSASITTDSMFANVTLSDGSATSASSSSSASGSAAASSSSKGAAMALATPFVQAVFAGVGLAALI
ncbi:hypothetical protein ANO11243_055770 [Dothideomycetidae sp. 11243]|nr:hypothetical protein ANO11243_055770 [fungal sp. No.11243]